MAHPAKLVVVVALLMVAVPAAAEDANPAEAWKPLAAVALASGSWATVSWTPGEEVGDAYHVYGILDDTMILLMTIEGELNAEVQSGFSSYAVTAVKSGLESPPQIAVLASTICISVDPGTPPRVAVGCMKPIVIEFYVELTPGAVG